MARSSQIQSLEPRLLFWSADVNDAGVLVVTGEASAADHIIVEPGENQTVRVYINAVTWGYPLDEVRAVSVRALSGNDTIEINSDDLPLPIIVSGAGGADTISGGDDGAIVVNGGSGADQITAAGVLRGGSGADRLVGKDKRDFLFGGGGDDSLTGAAGKDILFGNKGNDTLDGDAGIDRLFGSEGNDQLNGGTGKDQLFGGADTDSLFGNGGDDTLFGGASPDQLDGGTGTNSISEKESADIESLIDQFEQLAEQFEDNL